jgi:hypothetical protein
VLDDEGVPRPATGRGQHHRLARERLRLDQIEQMLEEARIGALVDGRADDQGVRPLDGSDEVGRLIREIAAGERGAEAGAGVNEIGDAKGGSAATGPPRRRPPPRGRGLRAGVVVLTLDPDRGQAGRGDS